MATEDQNIKITFDTNAAKAAQDVNKLGGSIDSATNATNENNQAVNQSDEAYKSFKTQLREANAELQKQIQLTGESSQETIKAAKAVAELKDQMGFAKDLADSFNPDQKMKALGAATQVAGTGMQGLTAGMALFGSESEDTQKQLLKVQAAMAFSDAISQMSNLGDQWKLLKATITSSSIATKANAAATGVAAMVQNVFTGSVATSTAGFKALKFAIAATGIGLLVVGLVAVYQNFDKISKFMTNLVPGLAGVGKMIGNIVNAVTDFVGVTSEADRALDRIKANADQSLALNKKFLSEHGDQLNEFTKQKIEAKNRYNEAVKEDGADQIALAKRLNRELAAIEHSRGDEARKIQKENAEKAAEEAEKRRQKAVEDEVKRKEKEKADKEDLTRAEFDANAETIKQLEDKDKENFENKQEEDKTKADEEAARKIAHWQFLADEEIRIQKAKAEQEDAIQSGRQKLAEAFVGFLRNIAGKNKALQKAAIIAESALGIGKSVIETNASNVATTAQGAALAIPTGGASVAAAAGLVATNYATLGLGVAANIAATAKALQALGSGGGVSAGGSVGGGSTRGAAPPNVAFNNSAENQIGQSVSRTQAEQPPLQVTVLESDITKAQNNVNVLVKTNTI